MRLIFWKGCFKGGYWDTGRYGRIALGETSSFRGAWCAGDIVWLVGTSPLLTGLRKELFGCAALAIIIVGEVETCQRPTRSSCDNGYTKRDLFYEIQVPSYWLQVLLRVSPIS